MRQHGPLLLKCARMNLNTMKAIPLSEAIKGATQGPLYLKPFLTQHDECTMGVYGLEPREIQNRIDNVRVGDSDEEQAAEEEQYAALYRENQMNCLLLAHCFNRFPEVVEALLLCIQELTSIEVIDKVLGEVHESGALARAIAAFAKAEAVEVPD